MTPPSDLVRAFIVAEQSDHIAALAIDDGIDAQAIRVLVAWQSIEHDWRSPGAPAPSSAEPSAAAWRWLWLGAVYDLGDLAEAAGLSRAIARRKLHQLIGARLVYPGGDIAKAARGLLQAVMVDRIKALTKRNSKPEKTEKKPPGDAN